MLTQELIYKIEIVRSNKRIRTISARLKNGIMFVNAPANTPEKELQKVIEKFKNSFARKAKRWELNKTQNLKDIAEKLNSEYFEGKLNITSIEYSTNQNSRFGCCNVKTGRILVSHRLAQMRVWVRDYVIIHELAHLIVPNHSKAFHELMTRYKLGERAKGYLMAKGYSEQEMEDENIIDDILPK
jgi:hypothetical protein